MRDKENKSLEFHPIRTNAVFPFLPLATLVRESRPSYDGTHAGRRSKSVPVTLVLRQISSRAEGFECNVRSTLLPVAVATTTCRYAKRTV